MNELKGCALYFDCFAGIAGDMTLGALIDLGVPEAVIRAELDKLPLRGWRLEHARVKRGALMGVQVDVHVDAHEPKADHDHHHAHDPKHGHHHGHHPHTHYRDIRAMLTGVLIGDVLHRALAMFDRIATVEARLHGVSVEEVAFHEVGAVDSIVDIVGVAAALAWMAPAEVTSRRVALGGGTVETAHGRLPVPAPATLELLRGAAVEGGGESELTTPTGAAILAATATAYGPMPELDVVAVGWGAGHRELGDRPNLLRIVAGRPAGATAESGDQVVIEANVDDMNPELCEPLMEALFAAGALDVWLQNILMKKGRPALLVSALCDAPRREAVIAALLRESTSIGVRHRTVSRTVLPRRMVEVHTPWGTVPIKVAGTGDDVFNAAPEYEVCRRLAKEHDVPVKAVYLAALGEYYRTRPGSRT